jgi:hypothetical protein
MTWSAAMQAWTKSNLLTSLQMTSSLAGAHRSSLNPLIPCELEHLVVWNRSRGSRRFRWWWRRYLLVIGTLPVACLSGGARRWPVQEFYWMRGRWQRILGWPEAHADAEELASEVAGGRTREIIGVQSSRCRACRRRLGASRLDWLDVEKEKTMAELQSLSARLRVTSNAGEKS